MEKKIVTFRGITNVPDDGFNEAGDMAVLLNMRHKGGELVPCQPPAKENRGYKIKQALYHANSEHWLELEDNGLLYYRKNDSQQEEQLADGVMSFAIMGNIVIMYGEDFVHYAIWRNGGYVYLGPLPEVPIMKVTKEIVEDSLLTEGKYEMFYNSDTSELYNGYVQKGFIDHALSLVYKQGVYIDRAFFIVALRLFDGTYIATSSPYQISMGERTGEVNTVRWEPFTGSSSDRYKATAKGFVPTFKFLDEHLEYLEGYEDIVLSIDVFTSGSIMNKGVKKATYESKVTDGTTMKVGQEYEMYDWLSVSEIKENIENAVFRKIAEFDLKGNKVWDIKDTSPSSLAVQDVLVFNTMHSYIPKDTIIYNSHLHIYNNKSVLFKGHDYYVLNENSQNNPCSVYTFLKTENGVKVVKSEAIFDSNDIPGYIIYPDSRAFKMQIFNEDAECVEIPLKAHGLNNYAFYISVVDHVIPGSSNEDENAIFPAVYSDFGFREGFTEPNIDNIVEQSNVLKVSAVDNPFYFPTAQTYKFEGDIVGLASNAEAISTGQFGQYPLFVFTDTGIWAMAVDTSGQGAYTTQSPFSREVCNGAICPVSGGVVFATDKGVMAISGGQVTDLSAVLDGFEVDFFEENAMMWEYIFAKVGKDAVVNPVPIREYIKGAVIAYNYHYNEIIVSNITKSYSYVYSLTNRVWSVIDVVFDLTTNKYPELVVLDKDNGMMYTFKDGAAKNNVAVITRPFTMGSLDFKRIRQAGLRTTFEGSLNFYLLGSIDGAVFKCITGKECDSGDNGSGTQRDLITAMSRSKQYKYFAIAIAGNIGGRVSMAELLVDAGFANNKIR